MGDMIEHLSRIVSDAGGRGLCGDWLPSSCQHWDWVMSYDLKELLMLHQLVWGVRVEPGNTQKGLVWRKYLVSTGKRASQKIWTPQYPIFCITELQYWVELSVFWILYSILIISRIWLFIQLQFRNNDWKASGISYLVPAVKTLFCIFPV